MQTRSIAKKTKADHDLAAINGQGPAPTAEVEVVTAPEAAADDDPAAWTAEADFEALRIPEFLSPATKPATVLKVLPRMPRKQEWLRVRPGPDWRGNYGLLRDARGETLYAVVPALHDELADEVRSYLVVTAVNTEREVFLWPVPIGESHGRTNSWWESALEAAQRAESAWVRVRADQALGRYEVLEDAHGPEPVWPEVPFGELFKLAFKDRVIASLQHPFVRKLRSAS
jgi:hypothetical protein